MAAKAKRTQGCCDPPNARGGVGRSAGRVALCSASLRNPASTGGGGGPRRQRTAMQERAEGEGALVDHIAYV